MELSRRDLSWLIPALAVSSPDAPSGLPVIDSTVYGNDQIPYKGDEKKKARRFFDKVTHTGFEVEVHETILGPGMESHAPHKHENEEIIIVLEGVITINVEGKTQPATAGSVITYASNQMHNLRNSGDVRSRYYVVELRGNKSA